MQLRMILMAAAMAAAGGLALAQDEPPSAQAAFADWTVDCDNGLACTAIGYGANPGEEIGAHLYLTRGAAAADPAKVEIGLGWHEAPQALKNGDQVEVAVDGPDALTFTATIRRGPESYESPELLFPAARRTAFLNAIIRGSKVRLSHRGAVFSTISLAGSSAALRYMDDRQRRAGGVTALVARGPKPASAVLAPPALPVIRLAPRIAQKNLPALPPALANREDVQMCAGEYDEPKKPGVSRLSATEYLWEIPCGQGAYNFLDLFIISRRDGSGARSPGFSNGADADQLVNGGYDPRTRLLTAFAKGRGLGDCGDEATWAWDGREFRLVHHRAMGDCLGITSEHWPVLWRARTSG